MSSKEYFKCLVEDQTELEYKCQVCLNHYGADNIKSNEDLDFITDAVLICVGCAKRICEMHLEFFPTISKYHGNRDRPFCPDCMKVIKDKGAKAVRLGQ